MMYICIGIVMVISSIIMEFCCKKRKRLIKIEAIATGKRAMKLLNDGLDGSVIAFDYNGQTKNKCYAGRLNTNDKVKIFYDPVKDRVYPADDCEYEVGIKFIGLLGLILSFIGMGINAFPNEFNVKVMLLILSMSLMLFGAFIFQNIKGIDCSKDSILLEGTFDHMEEAYTYNEISYFPVYKYQFNNKDLYYRLNKEFKESNKNKYKKDIRLFYNKDNETSQCKEEVNKSFIFPLIMISIGIILLAISLIYL